MSDIVLSVENLWKQYRLGVVGASSLREDVSRWLAKLRGKEDPTLKVGETNDRENLKGQYVWALQDINFEVKRGEVLGIIGKNGAGKSTLLKILSKVTTPTKGRIRTKGRIASLLEVGTGFHPELTGRENIFLNGAILGMTKNDIRKKFDEIVEFSGVGKYIDTPVKRYSSGMYVRLAFAVAAHLEPEILIVDEVLAVGDAEFQKKCLGKMKDVSSEGRTVLFVSHDMLAIQKLCNKSILLKKGSICLIDSSFNVVTHYLNDGKNATLKKDLKLHTERSGIGNIKFEYVEFKSLYNTDLSVLRTGDSFKIVFSVNSAKEEDSVHIAIAYINSLGVQLTMLGTEFSNVNSLKLKQGINKISCIIKKNPLVSGLYGLTLFCKNKNGIQDWIINAFQFEVTKGDYYGTNKNLDNEQSIFLMDYFWQNEE